MIGFRTVSLVLFLASGSLIAPAIGQNGAASIAPSTLKLRDGTEVKLRFAEALSSKTATLDDPVPLVLDEDVKVGDTIVARAGAKALATVSNVKKAGMMGKGGELNIRLDSLRAGDNKIRLRGSKSREGEDKVGATV